MLRVQQDVSADTAQTLQRTTAQPFKPASDGADVCCCLRTAAACASLGSVAAVLSCAGGRGGEGANRRYRREGTGA